MVFEDPPGLFTITGGKLTTYRAMAEDLVDRSPARWGLAAGAHAEHPARAARRGVGAVHLATAEVARLGLPPRAGARLVQRYGDDWREAVRLIERDRSLGEPAADGLPVLNVELALARSREMAITDEDVLVRRVRLTTRDASARGPARPTDRRTGHTLTRIARGMTSNVAGVVPRISPSASIQGRVGLDPDPAGPQLGDVAVRQVRSAVDLRQRGEGVGLRPGHHEHLERPIAGIGLGRDLHAAAVEPAVRHHDI